LTDADEVRSFGLTGGPETREYQVIVHSASEVAGTTGSLRLTVQAAGASGNLIERGAPLTQRSSVPRALEREDLALLTETRLKERMRQELLRVGARPYRGPSGGVGPRLSVGAAVPTVGQRITFSMAVNQDLTVNCNGVNQIQAEVKLVGERFVFMEDVRAAGAYTAADYQELNQSLDDVVAPLLIEYFGEPPDLDGNDRVFILFTANVNEMTEPGSGSFIAGFFFAGDLSDEQTCPAGNQAELLYLQAPDPTGKFGDVVEVDFAKRVAKGTVAHEFQHLLNTTQRILVGGGGFGDLDDAWSDEGLSHIAEEISGLALAGMSLRTNLDYDQTLPTQAALDAFNVYHLFNLSRFGSFMLNPHSALALGDTGGGDPPGIQSLEMRGFAWNFLRWLADQYAPASPVGMLPGSGEHLLFRELSSGGPNHLRGTSNVERAVQTVAGQSVSWQQLIADYVSVPAGDDNGSGLDPSSQILTWDLRSIYGGLNLSNLGSSSPFDRPFPLRPLVIDLSSTTNTTRDFSVNASTGRYFTLRGGTTTPNVTLEVTTPTGDDVPGSVRAQVTILRIR
jgi:hypothetical protein